MIESIMIGFEGRHKFVTGLSPPVKGASLLSARVGSGSPTSSRERQACALVAVVMQPCLNPGSDCGLMCKNSTLVVVGTGTPAGVVQREAGEGAILPEPWEKIMSIP